MKRMVNKNKILNTKVGDDIHFYINGKEDRGIVVKMNNEYVMVAKEDGTFKDIHINDTFFVKDILVNKTWDLMDDRERYDALTKIHAPSPRFMSKTWNDLPQEIKKLLTEDKSYEDRGDIETDTDPDVDSRGDLDPDTGEYYKENKKNNGIEESHKKEDDMDSDWRGEKETREKADPETEALDHEQQNLEEQNESNESAKEDWARAEDGQTARKSEDFKKLKPVYEGNKEEKKSFYEEWLEGKSEQFRKIYGGKKKSDVEHGKYGGISTDTKYDIPESTGYEERPHISVEEAGRLPRTTFNESGSELTVPKGGKKEVGTFKAPPAIQKKLDTIKEMMGITDSGATNVVYGGSDNKYATPLQNSTKKGRVDNQVKDRE